MEFVILYKIMLVSRSPSNREMFPHAFYFQDWWIMGCKFIDTLLAYGKMKVSRAFQCSGGQFWRIIWLFNIVEVAYNIARSLTTTRNRCIIANISIYLRPANIQGNLSPGDNFTAKTQTQEKEMSKPTNFSFLLFILRSSQLQLRDLRCDQLGCFVRVRRFLLLALLRSICRRGLVGGTCIVVMVVIAICVRRLRMSMVRGNRGGSRGRRYSCMSWIICGRHVAFGDGSLDRFFGMGDRS